MALTIDDIYDKEFALKGGGYDRDDVDQFLDEICDEMTNLQEKISALEAQLAKAQDELRMEKEAVKPAPQSMPERREEAPVAKTSETLESILLSAQRLSDEALENARKKADDIVKAAQDKASQIVDDAQEEKQTLEKSYETLKASASGYHKNFLDMLKRHQEMLEADAKLFQDEGKKK